NNANTNALGGIVITGAANGNVLGNKTNSNTGGDGFHIGSFGGGGPLQVMSENQSNGNINGSGYSFGTYIPDPTDPLSLIPDPTTGFQNGIFRHNEGTNNGKGTDGTSHLGDGLTIATFAGGKIGDENFLNNNGRDGIRIDHMISGTL